MTTGVQSPGERLEPQPEADDVETLRPVRDQAEKRPWVMRLLLQLTAWIAVFGTPQLLVMSLIFEDGHVEAVRSAGPVVWAAVLYLGLVMTAFGYALWYTLVRRHPVSTVAPFLLLLPVFSVIGGILFLGEELTGQIALGGAIVVAGVTFILIERRGSGGTAESPGS